ncbi:MAG: 3'-5' exonuclease [Ferruginibacter sp.]|nr:3'-5' exonuclease [Cytophagales bacterium]
MSSQLPLFSGPKHRLKLRKPLAFFDLETTGLNLVHDRVVEICIAKAMPNGDVIIKTRRINPTIPIPLETSLIHGIYDEDIKDAPPFKAVAHVLSQFLEGADLAGFNSNRFDVPMLVEEFLRAGLDFDLRNRRLIDVQRIYHLMEPRNLAAAYRFYCGKDLVNAHTAEADTLATFEVLNEMVQRYEGTVVRDAKGNETVPVRNDMDTLHALSAARIVDLAGRMALNDKGEEIFTFGKHKDRLVREILEKEPAYYDWVMKGEFPLDTKRKLTEIKLRLAFSGKR